MRRLIAALVCSAALGALPLVTAGPAAADPVPDPRAHASVPYDPAGSPFLVADGLDADDTDTLTAGVVRARPAAAHRFVSSWRCRAGGGLVIHNWQSPTRLSCIGGSFNSYWVVRYGL